MTIFRWAGAGDLPEDAQRAIFGPGAPFELHLEDVLGVPLKVFVQRPPHLPAVLAGAAETHGDRVYLSFPEEDLTFPEVLHRVRRVAGRLHADFGVGPGDRVGIVSANTLGYALAYWATLELGAIVAGFNGWWTAPELEHGIALATPTVILGDEPRLARLADVPDVTVPVVPFHELLDDLDAAPLAPSVRIHEDDPAVILFTSGTTGRSKGATLSHRNYVHFIQVAQLNGAVGAARAGIVCGAEQPSSISGGPFFHISGSVGLLSAPWSGAKIVFPPPGRWDETVQLELMARHRVSICSGVPTNLWRLVQHPDLEKYDLSSVRVVGAGGANFPPKLTRVLTERLPHVTLSNGYGMSESTGLGVTIAGPQMVAHPDAVGLPSPTVELELRDVDGAPVADGEVGEICLRHASIFLGYWENPEATAAALDGERWYRSGDYGRIVDGLLHLESRVRDLIIRGGENIYPVEIENRLLEHPGIDDVAVVGVDHQTLGQEVLAVVLPVAGADVDADAVRAWARTHLASFKVPAHVVFVEALPYTETGKVQKHVLEARWRAGDLIAS